MIKDYYLMFYRGTSSKTGLLLPKVYTLNFTPHNNYKEHSLKLNSGPLPKTTVDFWRMVWQERSQTIVMLTNLKDGTKTKCHQYWPDTGTQCFGPFEVTITGQQILADYTTRYLTVQVSNAGVCLSLVLLLFTSTNYS